MRRNRNGQRGIALITALLFLVLLSAMAIGLMYMATTETQINTNFRAEQTVYYAARGGMEEMRDRMMASSANTISGLIPTALPTSSGGNIVYLLNEGGVSGSVQPWNTANAYFDTELCHDGYSGLTTGTANVPCTASYSGTPTYVSGGSVLPFAGSAGAIPFKWVRLAMKQGNSVLGYAVNKNNATSTAQVCWNGSYELLLSGATTCSGMSPSANPVYMLTALAVMPSGARKMVQGEVALTPSQPFLYGLFATGTGCGAVTLSGNVATDSYTTAGGGTYASTHVNTGGDVGSNGNVAANGSVSIGGSVASAAYAGTGACPGHAFTTTGGASLVSGLGNTVDQIAVQNIPTPTIPSTSGPNQSNPSTLSPGNYGDITLNAHNTLTLGPGTYNINSLSLAGQAVLAVTGAVTINVQGTGKTLPIDLQGGAVTNNSGIANNLQINYAGTGSIKVAGGTNSFLVIDAPNASLEMVGNSDIYGAVVANQITNTGTPKFHYDRNAKSPVPSNSYYTLISFREVYY